MSSYGYYALLIVFTNIFLSSVCTWQLLKSYEKYYDEYVIPD
jgi:hypothetical protein